MLHQNPLCDPYASASARCLLKCLLGSFDSSDSQQAMSFMHRCEGKKCRCASRQRQREFLFSPEARLAALSMLFFFHSHLKACSCLSDALTNFEFFSIYHIVVKGASERIEAPSPMPRIAFLQSSFSFDYWPSMFSFFARLSFQSQSPKTRNNYHFAF